MQEIPVNLILKLTSCSYLISGQKQDCGDIFLVVLVVMIEVQIFLLGALYFWTDITVFTTH